MTSVLVIDDEQVLARRICAFLAKRGISADYATTARDGLDAFVRLKPRMTLVDYRIGEESGLDVLREIRERDRSSNVVVMTGHGDISIAVDAMKAGARDFLTKPAPLATIAEIAASLVAEPQAPEASPMIAGRSASIEAVRREIAQSLEVIAAADTTPPPVMIMGETGTGKELAARMLHGQGPRAGAPFISLNCAALPPHLVEAELFGHTAGAFTDARTAKTGLFEAANHGVLFLDEVGELAPEVQAKLLRVLEDRSVRPIGATGDRPVDVWVISATNRSLADMVQDGRFRQDLLYRLQVLWFEMPPLRERDSDILVLARRFLAEQATRYRRPVPELTDDARAALLQHRWPGNVRELRNVIERATVRAVDGRVSASDLGLACGAEPDVPGRLEDMERAALRTALEQTGGNVTRAAERLGISRDTLRYRLRKHRLA